MIRVMEGDCRAVLATLPAQSVQCCVTSPPYYGLRDYGVDGQIGLEKTPDEYVAEMVAVFREVRRVLRDDGVLWLNLGDSFSAGNGTKRNGPQTNTTTVHGVPLRMARGATPSDNRASVAHVYAGMPKPKDLIGIPWMVAFALRADGWYLRSEVIWAKPNPMPESVTDRPTKAHEQVFLLSKSARYFYDADAIREDCSDTSHGSPNVNPGAKMDALGQNVGGNLGRWTAAQKDAGRNARTIWTIATQPYSGAHFATMPPDLAERCIKAGSSEKGCCPHCGAPWGRVVERTTSGAYWGSSDGREGELRNDSAKRAGRVGDVATVTTGFSPSCDCPPHDPIPCTILDPFGGAGTTALVADRLGRNATIVELNPEYAALARERVTADAGMFAQIGMEA